MMRSRNGKLRRASRSSASAPSRSCTLAGWTFTANSRPRVSVRTCACGQAPSCQRHSRTCRAKPPFDGTLCGLAVDDRRRRARLAPRILPHLNIERVVNALERSVPIPQVEVLPDGAARRQVLRQRLPLAPRPEHIEDPVEDLTNVHRSRAAAALGRTDQRSDQRPFGVRQITLIPQAAPIRRRSMFRLPHEAPPNQVPSNESQAIPAIQVLSGRALREGNEVVRRQVESRLGQMPPAARERVLQASILSEGTPPALACLFGPHASEVSSRLVELGWSDGGAPAPVAQALREVYAGQVGAEAVRDLALNAAERLADGG